MQMLYNSDNFVVVQFDLQVSMSDRASQAPDRLEAAAVADADATQAGWARGGYEIVDKFARKEIFLDGVVAEGFREGVQALMRDDPSAEDMDEFISRYTVLAHAPLALH